jgi:predicted acetyltransferase
MIAAWSPLELVWPGQQYLASYRAALERGWPPNIVGGDAAARAELETIAKDPARYLAGLVDREATGDPIVLPDGSTVPRIPAFRRWLWDGEFCGFIALRWQSGTAALPLHFLGHVSYAVVPWKQGRGYATQALRLLVPDAKREGLPHVDIAIEPHNVASRRVIEANGGTLVESFVAPPQYGGRDGLRFRITLA